MSLDSQNNEEKEFDLFFLIQQCNFEKLTELFAIHYFPDVNVLIECHQNGIFYAARFIRDDSQCLKMISFLIKNNLNPLLIDSNNQTVLFYTCAAGFVETTKYLYENFAFDKYQVDKMKETPLFYAVKYNRVEIVNYLYSKGFDINHENAYGENCLFSLKGNRYVEMAKCLLNKGVDINNKGRDGITFLQFINKVGWYNILNMIEGINGDEVPENKCFLVINTNTNKVLNEEEINNLLAYNNIVVNRSLLGKEKDYNGSSNLNDNEHFVEQKEIEKYKENDILNSYGLIENNSNHQEKNIDNESSDLEIIDINAC